jgi:GNAT superfamily N-acetyltransferase
LEHNPVVPITVRPALPEDAPAVCAVLRASITQLCTADHHSDPGLLSAWLANKTVFNVARWVSSKELQSVVACNDTDVRGFGAIRHDGHVLFCYVDPQARFQRASTLLLAVLEGAARGWGVSHVHLTSTQTARQFYAGRGYRVAGDDVTVFEGMRGTPMAKLLVVT